METIQNQIEKYRQGKANVLVPMTIFNDPCGIFEPVLEVVQISINPVDGEAYSSTNQGKFRLSGVGLSKLAQCAGVEYISADSGVKKLIPRKYCEYAAVGQLRKADGRPVRYKASYAVDLSIVEEELIAQYEKKATTLAKKENWTAERKAGYITFCINRDLLQKRKFMTQLAESGARNRVVRGLLGLKGEYTSAELQKPFVMITWRVKIDYSDPEIKREAMLMHIRAAAGIYGQEAQQTPPQLPGLEMGVIEEEAPPQHDEEPMPDDMGADEPPPENTPEPTDEEIFSAFDKATKIRTLKEIAKKKGYDLGQLTLPMEQWTEANYSAFYAKLAGMKEVEHA